MFKFRMIGPIVRASGLVRATVIFIAIFLLCSLAVMLIDPNVNGYGDALWFCYQAVATIGFGDIVITAPLARIVTVFLSITSIFYLAIITGTVVSYCSEAMHARRKESVAQFLDELEHLEDLDKDQLKQLSAKVKTFRKNNQA